jgi:HEPN domain-containing protein
MSDPADPGSWAEKAEEDYQLVLLSLRRKKPLTYGATFHAQQCAEKYLKGLLVRQGQSPPKIHDLAVLHNLCEKVGMIVPVGDEALELLTRYATKFRYPGAAPTVEDAKEALEIAKIVRRFAKSLL